MTDTTGAQPPASIIQSRGVSREMVEILRQEIWSFRLRPGQRLNEQHLATRYGLSRPPLREAIRTLEAEGLVVAVPRKGTFVRVLTPVEVREMYAVRTGLEKIAASLIIARPDLDQVADALHQLLDNVEDNLDDLPKSIAADIEFHRCFVRHSGNGRLLQMWEQLIGEIRLALTVVDAEYFESEYFESTHRSMIETLRSRDEKAVSEQMAHLSYVVTSLCERWSEYAAALDEGSPSGAG
ncbi:GntR family transcriptional regulator [Mycolicibacterium sp.]|uniref:GntR family transcriptional regulator n=1 Tax=Mycolicibacterium sp. TaxID=2320850 RepID=UPI003D1315D7